MRKGNLVRLNAAKCFSKESGGGRRRPLTNYRCDEDGVVEGTSLVTEEELKAWRDSDASKGMTSGGDTKLPPTCRAVSLHRDCVYTLLRARCAPVYSYRRHPGMAAVLCTETGRTVYIKRELLEVVG